MDYGTTIQLDKNEKRRTEFDKNKKRRKELKHFKILLIWKNAICCETFEN